MSTPYAGIPSAIRNASTDALPTGVAPAVRSKLRLGRPKHVVRGNSAVGSLNAQIHPVPLEVGAGHSLGEHGQTNPCQNLIRRWPGQPKPNFSTHWNQFYIVHDDEALKMAQQALILVGGDFEFQRVTLAPDREVALNAPLRIQNQVPRAGVIAQIVDGVGDHPAQPAEPVFSAHFHAPQPAQIVARRSCCQGG